LYSVLSSSIFVVVSSLTLIMDGFFREFDG
jgi:hypothetical protein